MKKLLVVTGLVLSSMMSYGQSKKEIINTLFPNGVYKSMDSVMVFSNKNRNEIYRATKLWFGKTFKSSKSVIETDVPGELILGVGNYSSGGGATTETTYWFTVTTMIKDGKIKVSIDAKNISPYGAVTKPLQEYYDDYVANKNGFFSTTGAKSYKEWLFSELVYKTNVNMISGLAKEINNSEDF